MSILIKGYTKKDFEELVRYARYGANNCMIAEGAEAVEIPPHGRLIDADELCKRLLTAWHTAETEEYRIICEVMSDVVTPIVVGTPTVIEADYPPSTPLEQVWTELFGEDGE